MAATISCDFSWLSGAGRENQVAWTRSPLNRSLASHATRTHAGRGCQDPRDPLTPVESFTPSAPGHSAPGDRPGHATARWGANPVTSPVQYQNVWGVGYVNELVLRDQFATNGTLSQRLYVLQDANYDVTALVNTSGVVQERFVYDPYGAVSVLNASWGSTTDSFGWRYEFQGGRSELVTGWVGFDNRDYIPSEARWAQQDPLGLAADNNSYRFVGNNPIDFTDPTGFAGNSPYNKPIPGMPTPNGDGPMFSPFGQTPYMIPNKPTNSSNAIFFVGPPGRTSTTPDVNDTYMFKIGYAAALGVPPENIFYYNGLNSLKNAVQDALTLGLKNPDVFFWGHGHPGGLMAGNPGWPGYNGNRRDGKTESINSTNFGTFAGLVSKLGPRRTTLLACNFVGELPKNYVELPVLSGLPLLSNLAKTTGAPATGLVGFEAPYLVNNKWGWYLQNGGYYITVP